VSLWRRFIRNSAHFPAVIAMSPFTTSIDITGSPLPSVVYPNLGPNLSFIVNGMSDVR